MFTAGPETTPMSIVINALGWLVVPMIVFGVLGYVMRQKRKADPTHHVQRTRLGRVGRLATDVDLLVSAGTGGAAHDTLGEKFLRPSWGMRLFVIALPVIAVLLISKTYGQAGIALTTGPIDYWLVILIGVLILHSLIYFNIYELQFDKHRFAHRNWFFRRNEYDWKNVTQINDDGAYFFVLRMKPGGKTYVPKHLRGIGEFVRTAQAHIAANSRS